MKKLYALFLSLVMMFAFASTAMAAEAPAYPTEPGFYVQWTTNGAYELQAVTVQDGESVYDLVIKTFTAERAKFTSVPSTIGDKTGMVLKSLDGKGSVPYNSEVLKPYQYYTSAVKDATLARVNDALLAKYSDSDGLGLWMGNGTGYSNDGPYMAYVGDDWTFTVNGSRPLWMLVI